MDFAIYVIGKIDVGLLYWQDIQMHGTRSLIAKEGQTMFKESAIVTAFVTLLPIVIGILMAILLPNAIEYTKSFAYASCVLYGVGFLLFLIAKLSVIKGGKWTSFGSTQMSHRFRQCYRCGYVFMVAGFVSTLALVLATRVR